MSVAAPIIRATGIPTLGFSKESYPNTTLRRSTTSPILASNHHSTNTRTRQIVERFAASTTALAQPTQVSRDPATQRTDPNQTTPKTTAMTTQEQSEAKAFPTCSRQYDDAAEEKKPAGNTIDIDGDIEDKEHQLPPLPKPLPTAHPQFVHCVPPNDPTYRDYSVFLAGSIEMGKAIQWQKQMATELSTLPITVNNPRRGHWDPEATQSAKDAAFAAQVEWELSALEKADVICFFFDTETKSPVSMLELGLWAHSGKVIVCCGDKFWRAGNIHLVCERYGVPFVKTFAELVPAIKERLHEKGLKI
jgi:hypothetical protein